MIWNNDVPSWETYRPYHAWVVDNVFSMGRPDNKIKEAAE